MQTRHARRLARPSTVLAVLLLSSGMPSAAALVINVNSTADANDAGLDGVCETAFGNHTCTLRAALAEAGYYANTVALPVSVNLPAGLYVLTSGPLLISQHNVSLVGAGASVTTIDANQISRAITTSGASHAITISGITVTGGKASTGAEGGGIDNTGADLTVSRCVVRDCKSPSGSGGGIASSAGSLTVVDSVIQGNMAPGHGGGGIYAGSTKTVVSRTTVSGNTAGIGAGIEQDLGSLKIVDSTISSNAAADFGGGLLVYVVPSVTLNSVTMVGNVADADFDGLGEGGGISFSGSAIVLSNSVLNNYNYYGPNNDDLDACGSLTTTVTSNGFNIIEAPGACAVLGAYSTADFAYGPLQDNGGFGKTNALPAGSVAINAGNPGGCTDSAGAPLTTDQRGVSRSLSGRCDLGAFETEPIGDVNGDGTVSVQDVFYLVNTLFASGPLPFGRANVNGDSAVSVLDVFYLINYLFAQGPAPV